MVAQTVRGGIQDPIAAPPDRIGQPLAPPDERVGANRFACIGEASHRTHEHYQRRAELSRCLIQEHGYRCIGVEGNWPDCWRINRWLRGQEDQDLAA